MNTATEMAMASLSPNTRRCYVNHFLEFLKFIKRRFHNDNLFPAKNAHVITYLAHLYMLDYAPATLLVKVSAITYIHKLSNFSDPCNCFLIKHMLTGAKKLKCKPDNRKPILLPDLYKLVDNVEKLNISPYNKWLIKAMFLLAFHAFLRVGEITQRKTEDHNLQYSDLTWEGISAIIHMKTYKHSNNRPVFLRIDKQTSRFCPIYTLRTYLSLRGSCPGPLFCLSDGQAVSRTQFTRWLQLAVTAAGLSSTSFKSHSFRIGAATTAASLGMTDEQIRLMGRWHSDSFKKYMRIPMLSLNKPSGIL